MQFVQSFSNMINGPSSSSSQYKDYASIPKNLQQHLCTEIFPKIKQFNLDQNKRKELLSSSCTSLKSITETLFIFSCKLSKLTNKSIHCLFFINVVVKATPPSKLTFTLVTTPFLKPLQRSPLALQVVPKSEMALFPEFVSTEATESMNTDSFEENVLKPYFVNILNFIQLNETERDLSSMAYNNIFQTCFVAQDPSRTIIFQNKRSLTKVCMHTCFSENPSQFHVLDNGSLSTTIALFHLPSLPFSSSSLSNNKRSFTSSFFPPPSPPLPNNNKTKNKNLLNKRIKLEPIC